jgi:hypothetical protein
VLMANLRFESSSLLNSASSLLRGNFLVTPKRYGKLYSIIDRYGLLGHCLLQLLAFYLRFIDVVERVKCR